VNFLAKNKTVLEKIYRISTPCWDITRFAAEKILTYQLAEKFGIPIPRTLYPRNLRELASLDIQFPAILKLVKEPFYSPPKESVRVNKRTELIKEYDLAWPSVPE
jgi:predicted ATP-grasp superfamily ATP-dependent carboligase